MITTTQKIPSGYKQTEIGVIPADWDVKKLGDLGEIKMCRRIFSHETKEVGTIPFYKIGTFGKEADAYIPQDLYDDYRHRFSFPKKGDILISAAGTIGRTIVYDGIPAYFQDSNIVWIDNNEELISNGYLYYVFQIVKYNTEGGTIQRLYNSILKSAKFICPTNPQQTAIVSILSDTDALITKTEKLIQKKKNIKKGAMQELLTGKRRLAGFSGKWDTEKLECVLKNITTGLNPRQNFSLGSGYNYYVTIKNFSNGKLFLDDKCDKVGDHALTLINKRSKLEVGDILFASIGTEPSTYLINVVPKNWNINESVFSLKPDKKIINSKFLQYLLVADWNFETLSKDATGSTFQSIKIKQLKNLQITYPRLDEQTAIAAVLSDMDTEIEKLESQLTKYQNIKQGMMQTLLTGKIRLLSK